MKKATSRFKPVSYLQRPTKKITLIQRIKNYLNVLKKSDYKDDLQKRLDESW